MGQSINGISFLELTQEDFLYMNIKLGPTKEFLKIIGAEKNKTTVLLPSICNAEKNGKFVDSNESILQKELDEFDSPACKKRKHNDNATSDEIFSSIDLDNIDFLIPDDIHDETIILQKQSCRNTWEQNIEKSESIHSNVKHLNSEDHDIAIASTSGTNRKSYSNKFESIPKTSNAVGSTETQNQFEENVHSRSKSLQILNNSSKFTRYETVEETLLKHPQGKALVKAARTTLTQSDRRLLVRIVIAELIATHDDNYYPPTEALEALAKAVVTEFPLLKNSRNKKGYEHYYDPETREGFFKYRLMTIRKALPAEKKKYKIHVKSNISTETDVTKPVSNGLNKDQLNEKISTLKYIHPSRDTKSEIVRIMKDTYLNRREWIETESPSIVEIHEKYPRLIDFNGLLIDKEFELMFSDKCNNFISKFPAYYVPRILNYAALSKPSLLEKYCHIKDDNLKALLLLINLTPTSNALKKKNSEKKKENGSSKGKKKSKVEDSIDPQKNLLEFISEVTDIDVFMEEKRKKVSLPVQPYIVAVESRIPRFHVVGDKCIISRCNSSEIIPTFDLLFKFLYVCNVQYPRDSPNIVSALHIALESLNNIEFADSQKSKMSDNEEE